MDNSTVAVADSYVPEEIFLAANLSTVPLTHLIDDWNCSSGKLPAQSCLYCRQAEMLCKQLSSDALFGVVFASSCTAMEKLYEIIRSQRHFKWVEILDVPKMDGPQARELFARRLVSMTDKLSQANKYRVTADNLQKAIRLINRFRALLIQKGFQRAVYCGNDPISLANLPGKIQLLEKLEVPQTSGPRLMIFGSRLREDIVAREIESQGGVAALFFTDDGYYQSNRLVSEIATNPFEALAEAYLGESLQRRSIAALPDVNRLTKLITRHAIDGILTLTYPHCAKMNYDVAWLKKHEAGLGVPVMNFQLDSAHSVHSGLRNRIGAFVEILTREN